MICLAGFMAIVVLTARQVMGAVIIGMLLATFVGWVTGSA